MSWDVEFDALSLCACARNHEVDIDELNAWMSLLGNAGECTMNCKAAVTARDLIEEQLAGRLDS